MENKCAENAAAILCALQKRYAKFAVRAVKEPLLRDKQFIMFIFEKGERSFATGYTEGFFVDSAKELAQRINSEFRKWAIRNKLEDLL